jgi:putative transposase
LDALANEFEEVYNNKKVVVFYQDEGRFGRISNEVACWVEKNEVPNIPKQMVREYVYAFSALSPQTGECYSIISPHCNTEAMSIFLNELSKKYSDYRIIMILDKAGWHRSIELEIPKNIKLLHLCPYSPELNPVELLWRQIRATYFNNLIFDSMDEVCKQLEVALKYMHDNNETIKKLSHGYKCN